MAFFQPARVARMQPKRVRTCPEEAAGKTLDIVPLTLRFNMVDAFVDRSLFAVYINCSLLLNVVDVFDVCVGS